MKEVTELFAQNFMLTADTFDPRDIDFTFYTQEKITNNADRNPALKQYFMTYDPNGNRFSDLAVDINFSYTLDAGHNITKVVETTNWYFDDGTIGATRVITRVYA